MAKSNWRAWQEERRAEERKVQHRSEIVDVERLHMDDRADNRRLVRRHQAELREAKMEENLLKFKENQQLQAKHFEIETKLTEEVLKKQQEHLLAEKMRLRLRESSEELKELERKLRAAYAIKELDAQLCEKRLATICLNNQERKRNELLRESWLMQEEEERQRECTQIQQKKIYRGELQNQMIIEDKKKQLLFDEFLREKRLIDEVVRKIQEEDQNAAIEKMEKLAKSKKEMEDFKRAQFLWREKEKEQLEEENKRIVLYLKKQGIVHEARQEELKKREEAKARLGETLARKLEDAERKKHERENILQELAEEQRLAEQEHRVHNDIKNKLRQRSELRETFRQQALERKARLDREAAEEAIVRQNLVAKMAEDARLEQLTRETQRRKMLQFRQEADEMIQLKRIQRAEELQRLVQMEELMKQQEKNHLQLVEEERLRMLKEHAKKLLGYLPVGVLRQSELPMLGPEFVEMYGSKQNNPPD